MKGAWIEIAWSFLRACGLGLFFLSEQVAGQSLSFEHLTPLDHGLDAQYNTFIKKDSKGFVWISSVSGVFRFDGQELKKFGSSTYPQMLGNNVQSEFFEDRKGNIWFSTMKGINCYHYGSDSFSSYQLSDPQGGLIENDYCLFYLQNDSILWLEAASRLYRFHPYSGQQVSLIETAGARFSVDTLSGGEVRAIYAAPWINAEGLEYIGLDQGAVLEKSFFLQSQGKLALPTPIRVSEVIVEASELVWVFSNQGLIGLNPQEPEAATLYPNPYGEGKGVLGGVLDRQRGYLWISTPKAGICVFDTKSGNYIDQIEAHPSSEKGLSTNSLLEIQLDQHNMLWASHLNHSAIDYAWLKRPSFPNPFEAVGGQGHMVSSLVQDSLGRIYCSTYLDQVYLFEPNGAFIDSLSPPEELGPGESLPLLRSDNRGRIWALNDSLIFLLEGESWKKYFHIKQLRRGEKILDLVHLSEEKKLLATQRGVFELSWSRINKGLQVEKELIFETQSLQVYQLIIPPSGRIFAPSQGKDVYVIDYGQAGELSIEKWNLSADVFSVWEAPSAETTLIGTSAGLYRLNSQTGSSLSDNAYEPSLGQTPIHNLLLDRGGRLWISTNNTLYLKEPEREELFYFTQEDGLPPSQFVHSVSLSPAPNKLWLGLHDGIALISTDSLVPFPLAPSLYLNELRVNHEPFSPEGGLNALATLRLSYDQNTLEFDIRAVGSYLGHRNQIAYQLRGYNSSWRYVPSGTNIEFGNISPGTYTLEFYGINANGFRGTPRQLLIEILPPIWERAWFIALCLLIIGLMIYWGLRSVVRKRLRIQRVEFEQQQRIKEALEEERTRIAEEMHDDLGSGLNSIRILLGKIKKNNGQEELSAQLQRVEHYAATSIEHMREIIWAMNSSNDQLTELISYSRKYVLEFFEDHNLVCHTQIPENLPAIPLSGEKRRNLFLCIKEGAHNILKHANASEVKLSFCLEQGFSIVLADNGKGFEPEKISKGGNGLQNMNKRIEKIGGVMELATEKGTQLRFFIPLSQLNPKV